MRATFQQRIPVILRVFIAILLITGVVLRIILWIQNRNLVMDEANVARNLYESDFAGLLRPLKYEQYAPPVFLWLEKTAALVFGLSERALRLYPMLCGIGSLLVFRKIAARLMPDAAGWLPVGLLASGTIYVEYSVTLKQYMPDALVGLLLVLLALRTDFTVKGKWMFFLIWTAAGSLAVWSSMPAVFILSGVGVYYFRQMILQRDRALFLPFLGICTAWLLQFLLYYFIILRPQIGSVYLQNFHRDFFLFAIPHSAAEWQHNGDRLYDIIGNMGGWTTIAMVSHILFLVTGSILLVRQNPGRFLLITLPVFATLTAAAFNQFSLIERVIMFMYPLLLLLVGYGFSQLLRIPSMPVRVILSAAGLISIFGYAKFNLYSGHRRLSYELTEGMDYLNREKASGAQLYVPQGSTPAYVYYTEVHPGHKKYEALSGGHLLKWSDNYSGIPLESRDTVWFIYAEDFQEPQQRQRTAELEEHGKQIRCFEGHHVFVYGYLPK